MSDRLIWESEIKKREHDVVLKDGAKHRCFDTTMLYELPTVDAVEVVRCKECKYFLYNKLYMVEGLPLMGNLVCEKWGNGCRTDENGYCFLGERKEDAEID